MKIIDIDYAQQGRKLPTLLTLALVAGAVLIGMMTAAHNEKLNTNIQRLEAVANTSDNTLSIMPNPALNETLALARETEGNLNIEWVKLLGALEQAQLDNRNIALTNINPNRYKQEVLLLGQANDFDLITRYIKSLESNALLSDVTLLKQSIDTDSDFAKINFTITVRWQS